MHLGGSEGLGHCWERERERSDGSTEGKPWMAQPLGDLDSWKCGMQVSEKEVTNLGASSSDRELPRDGQQEAAA